MDRDLKDLNLRFDQLYKDLFAEAQRREQRHDAIHTEMLEKIDGLSIQLEPVTKLFDNVSGFRQISLAILKGLIVVGAGVGVVYGFITWLRH